MHPAVPPVPEDINRTDPERHEPNPGQTQTRCDFYITMMQALLDQQAILIADLRAQLDGSWVAGQTNLRAVIDAQNEIIVDLHRRLRRDRPIVHVQIGGHSNHADPVALDVDGAAA